jgi:molecular chaperone DnaK
VSDIESALAEAKGKLDSSEASEINAAYDRLVKSSHKLAEIMYQQASQAGGQGGPTGASGAAAGGSAGVPGGDDNVIDADFVDVDDKK